MQSAKLIYNPITHQCRTFVGSKEDDTLTQKYSERGFIQKWFDDYFDDLVERLNTDEFHFIFHGTEQDAITIKSTLEQQRKNIKLAFDNTEDSFAKSRYRNLYTSHK